jgi:dCMP deaminase
MEPSKKHDLYMRIADAVALSSHCKRSKVGCIIVKNDNIIGIGYNGTPSGFENDCECNNVTKDEVLHAESNAIAKCAKSTISSLGSTMYCTLMPCYNCAKLIIQSGIKKVIYKEDYRDDSGVKLLTKANIEVLKYE